DPSGFQLQPLSASSGQAAYVADRLSRGVGDIAQQLASAEGQARAAQRALDAAPAGDTTSELKKDLTDRRDQEPADVNEQITNEDLRRNANLRKTVNEWKAKIYAELNKSLSENEQTAVAEAQESLTKAQQKGRAQLEASIAAYGGAQVGRVVKKQQAEQQKIM